VNTASLPLPVAPRAHPSQQPAQVGLFPALTTPALPRVEKTLRKGPVLQRSPIEGQEEICSLNLTKGCAHRCGFCAARAYPSDPGNQVVYLYTATAEQLERELASRTKALRAVYLCPSTDPIPPSAEIQAETARVVAVLARHGIDAWLMTRGYIRPAVLEVLAGCRQYVKVTVALTTVERSVQRALEPFTASPRLRLRQIRRLRGLGIPVQVALDPLLPGLTDTRDNLSTVVQALARAGITQVTAGYMFLRRRIEDNLVGALKQHGWDKLVLDAYATGPVLEAGHLAPARFLPKPRRQRGYAALMALAAELGITVRVNGASNPDFRNPRPATVQARPRQRLLPPFEEDYLLARPLQKAGV
jgi:DNA repair photolyase